jgi:hypothetical protein
MSTSLNDLVVLVRQRSNQENNNRFGVNEINTYINNSCAELYDILTTTYEDYDSHQFNAVLTDGYQGNLIPLLSDVNKVRAVEFMYMGGDSAFHGTDNFYPIQQFQMPNRNRYGNTPLNVFLPQSLANITYRVMGNAIIIEPIASCQGEYRIWYSQKWQNLVNPTDTLPAPMDSQAWSEYAVVDSCIKIFDKMNIDATGFRTAKAELKDRIVSAAKNRVIGGPKVMANTKRRNRRGWGGGGMGGGGWW